MHMTIVPRSREKYSLAQSASNLSASFNNNEAPSPSMSINSLGFAGMFLVKSEEEAEAVVKEGVVNMLRSVILCFCIFRFSLQYAGSPFKMSFEQPKYVQEQVLIRLVWIHRGVGVPRMEDDSLAEPQNKDSTGDN